MPFHPKCEMYVKDGPQALLWRCQELNDPCTNCGFDGTCKSFANDEIEPVVYIHYCACMTNGIAHFDECWTNVLFDTQTGVVRIVCGNECCNGQCPDPPDPLPAYPIYTDPCTCQ